MSGTDGYKVDYSLLKKEKPNSEMRNGNWNWVRCGDGYCIFTVPYYNKSLLIKDGRIKGYMNRYIKKYKKLFIYHR